MRDATDLGRPVAGVIWMMVTGLAFVAVSGIVKYVGTDIPAPQAAFLRFVFGVGFLAPALWAARGVRFPSATWRLFWWRGAIHVAAVFFWFWAVVRVPVAEMTAIGLLGPVVMVVLAAALMGEPLERGRLVAVLAALAGALVVLRPGLREITPGHMAQIAATLCFSASYLCAKRLSALAPASVVVALLSVTVAVWLMPLALWVWVPVGWAELGWLAAVAALGTLGHYTMTRAFQAAPIAVTQPAVFVQILWASLLGALVFAEPVDLFVILGGALIVAAVSMNAWSDARRDRVPLQQDV